MDRGVEANAQSLFHVTTRVHSETGFWGPVDSNHQFCEPHYASSYYLAEFYNSLSSFLYVALGIYLYRRLTDSWIRWACAWLVVIGFGSFLFHGTMRYSMQLLDEGPMVGFLGTCTLLKVKHHPWLQRNATFWRIVIFLQCIAVLLTYVWLNRYELFLHGFTALACVDAAIGYTLPTSETGWWLRNRCLLAIVIGKAIWEVENRFCQQYPAVWPLHVVWHLASCLSAYYGVLFNSLARNRTLDLRWAPLVPSLKAKADR
jgi:dihydroceramidase